MQGEELVAGSRLCCRGLWGGVGAKTAVGEEAGQCSEEGTRDGGQEQGCPGWEAEATSVLCDVTGAEEAGGALQAEARTQGL